MRALPHQAQYATEHPRQRSPRTRTSRASRATAEKRQRLLPTIGLREVLFTTLKGFVMAKSVFYSFHYDRDAWRVQQVRNMGVLDGQPLLNAQEWEQVRRRGNAAIQKWIKEQMAYKAAVVVLIGAETASRPWVRHEIAYAWDNYKPMVGVRIHGLADRNGYTDQSGDDPFSKVTLEGGGTVGGYVPLYTPSGRDSKSIYATIKENLTDWVTSAYKRS